MLFFLLIAYNFFVSSAYQLATALFVDHLQSHNFNIAVSALVTALFFFSSCIMRPASGRWAQCRAKPLVLWPALGMALCALVYALSTNIWLLSLARVAHGAAFAVATTASMAMFSRRLPKDKMGLGMGVFGLGQTLAVGAGPALGLFLKNNWADAGAFWGAATMLALATIIAFFLPADNSGGLQDRPASINKRLYAIAGIFVAFGMLNGLDSALILPYARASQWGDIGWYFVAVAAVLAMARPFFGRLADKHGMLAAMAPAYVCAAAFCAVLIFAQGPWALVGAAVLKGVALGASQPVLQAACVNQSGADRGGAAAFYMGADAGQGLGPLVGGIMVQGLGFKWAYGVLAGPLAASLLLFISAKGCPDPITKQRLYKK